ncbi:D-alanine--D-alanine ligase [Caviibacter abscessus]|uniref:D-alanine--D-alanine ligase n=1 Tax=Caviibacter abscessus TaxID=1766719 RepID=UPI00082EA296|nr:D-alanine--D-alanine ligase [Caviibacter abscessus]
MRVCVIYGGISTEREVSIKTGMEIIKELDKNKYEVLELRIDKKEDIFKIKDMNVDFAYIALHGAFGEDGSVQTILDTMGIAYSGSKALTSAICMDKEVAKRIVESHGIRTAKYVLIRKGESFEYPKHLGNKVIVKPNSGGSSIGISFATNLQELEKALEEVFKIDNEALVEEVIEGIEISVPIINGKVYSPVRIDALKSTFFDYNSKYDKDGANEYVYFFEEKVQKEINKFTEKIYYAVKCKGYARIDYLIKDNKAYMIEINTLPGMTSTSLLPKSLAYSGYSYSQILDLLIEVSK